MIMSNIQDKDRLKRSEAHRCGYQLIVIDVSKYKYWKQTEVLLDEVYSTELKPLIASWQMDGVAVGSLDLVRSI